MYMKLRLLFFERKLFFIDNAIDIVKSTFDVAAKARWEILPSCVFM